MKKLLVKVSVPHHHRSNVVAHRAGWYSWSPECIRLISENLDCIVSLNEPSYIHVRGCYPYNATHSYRLRGLPDSLKLFALEAAEALLQIRVGRQLKFLTGMLDVPFSSAILHKCFSLIRAGVVRLNGDPRAALHAPIKTEPADEGFPLHTDLFLTERLWLVFDNVPKGMSGKALFLSRDRLEAAIESNHLMPGPSQQKLRALLRSKPRHDSFDECYELIHAPQNPWTRSLNQAMKDECWAIKLRRGEGYLLNDRLWFHGRTSVNGPVPINRFRRLVYGEIAFSQSRKR